MNHQTPPLIAIPLDLSDEAAATWSAFLYELAQLLETHYASQPHRDSITTDAQQADLWPETDPPF